MKQCVWAFTKKGALHSISKEVTATILASEFPDTIYFFAEMVSHPDYDNEK